MKTPKKPDWDSFEIYEGAKSESRMPKWILKLFHWVMILVLISIVFVVCGGLAFILAYNRLTGRLVADESSLSAGIRFVVGGLLGTIWILRALYGRRSKPFS